MGDIVATIKIDDLPLGPECLLCIEIDDRGITIHLDRADEKEQARVEIFLEEKGVVLYDWPSYRRDKDGRLLVSPGGKTTLIRKIKGGNENDEQDSN